MRIIDNKIIDLTDAEFALYQKICAGYAQGADLFKDLFETDDEGVIVFLYPPSRPMSMEIVIYLQNIMMNQHLRKIYKEHDQAMKELKEFQTNIENQIKETLNEHGK